MWSQHSLLLTSSNLKSQKQFPTGTITSQNMTHYDVILCLPQRLFSAIIQNPIQKSDRCFFFVQGSRMLLISRLAFKTMLFLQHRSIKWYYFLQEKCYHFIQHMCLLMVDPIVCIVDHTSMCVSLKDKVKCVEVTCNYWHLLNLLQGSNIQHAILIVLPSGAHISRCLHQRL